jgi:hypothetical protein
VSRAAGGVFSPSLRSRALRNLHIFFLPPNQQPAKKLFLFVPRIV